MQKVGLKTLKNKLSEYVRLAASGETVVITDRGRTVAELVPPTTSRPARTPLSNARRARGLAEASDASATARRPPRKPMPGLTFEQLMADLDRDREDRCDLHRQFGRAGSVA